MIVSNRDKMVRKSINAVVVVIDRRQNLGKLPEIDLQCLVSIKGEKKKTELGRTLRLLHGIH